MYIITSLAFVVAFALYKDELFLRELLSKLHDVVEFNRILQDLTSYHIGSKVTSTLGMAFYFASFSSPHFVSAIYD